MMIPLNLLYIVGIFVYGFTEKLVGYKKEYKVSI